MYLSSDYPQLRVQMALMVNATPQLLTLDHIYFEKLLLSSSESSPANTSVGLTESHIPLRLSFKCQLYAPAGYYYSTLRVCASKSARPAGLSSVRIGD